VRLHETWGNRRPADGKLPLGPFQLADICCANDKYWRWRWC